MPRSSRGRPALVIARLDRAIIQGGMRNDATVKPWHDEWGTVITGPTLPILVIARPDRAIFHFAV